jgi:hypothetical protein
MQSTKGADLGQDSMSIQSTTGRHKRRQFLRLKAISIAFLFIADSR